MVNLTPRGEFGSLTHQSKAENTNSVKYRPAATGSNAFLYANVKEGEE
jgi:hypothetical protein